MERRLLGKRINQIRKERGLTSEALSEICDVNAGHIRPEIIESENKLLLKVESLTPKQKRILSDLLDTFKKSMNGDSVE